MREIAFRVDSAERERVVSLFIQAVHAGNSDTITCPLDLASHPLVVVSVRVAKLFDSTPQNLFETRSRFL
jgi:hypothetical protein